MNKNNITISPAKEAIRDSIRQKLIDYNYSHVPRTQEQEIINLDFIAKVDDKIVGGILSMIYCWKCLSIDILWIDEKYRHSGLGSKLITMVEQEAIKQGCHLAHLDTFDFQAKDFYLKHGYEIFGELDDCPPGHKRIYLKKKLS